jgi:hypothetical protein
MLVIFPEMINGGIYHDLAQPAFERTHAVCISGPVIMDLAEYFQKTIIQYFKRVILV